MDKLVYLKEETENVINNIDYIRNKSVKISTYFNNQKENFTGFKTGIGTTGRKLRNPENI